MAITIRNKTTEDLIRRIGRRTGEGPSAVVRRLAEREAGVKEGHEPVAPDIVKRRMIELEESRLRHSYPDDPKATWAEIEREMDSIFGDDVEPRRARR